MLTKTMSKLRTYKAHEDSTLSFELEAKIGINSN